MKNRLSNLFATRKSSFLPSEPAHHRVSEPTHHRISEPAHHRIFEPTHRRIKVSLHQLINDLLTNLQPLSRSRNNIIHNGVPQGLCFIAEENILALNLWRLLGNALQTRHDESIHVLALVDDHVTTISVKNAAHHFALSIPNTRLAR